MAFSFNKYCSDVLPAGKYQAVVTAAKFRTGADGSASKDIAVTYTIAEGPHAKRVISDTIFEKAHSFRLRPFLTACKVDTNREFGSMEEMFQYGLKEVVGKTVIIDVTTRTYNGREYNNVDSWSPIAGSTTSVDDVIKDFGTSPEMKADTAAADDAASKPAPVGISEAPKEPKLDLDVVDDDLPF